jgi:hypothetical protein
MKLGHILQSSIPVHIELEHFRFDELKRAARFWVGKEAGSYSKGQCIAALNRTMNGDDDAQRLLTALSEKERQILPIFTRYGPTVPGGLLTTEVYDRGLVRRPPENSASESYPQSYREWHRDDSIGGLREKLVLIGNSYNSHYSSSYHHSFPQLTLHPAIVNAVEPAAPISWSPPRVCDEGCRHCTNYNSRLELYCCFCSSVKLV